MTEILSPYYREDGTVVGDWIDLTDFLSATFEGWFSHTIDGPAFTWAGATCNNLGIDNYKIDITNIDINNALSILPDTDQFTDYATFYICDAAGNVVDYLTWTKDLGLNKPFLSVPSTGDEYWLIMATDGGNIYLKKDKQTPPVVTIDDTYAIYKELDGATRVIVNKINVDDVLITLDDFLIEGIGLTSNQIFFPVVTPPIDTGGGSGSTIGVPERVFIATDNRWFVATDNRNFTA